MTDTLQQVVPPQIPPDALATEAAPRAVPPTSARALHRGKLGESRDVVPAAAPEIGAGRFALDPSAPIGIGTYRGAVEWPEPDVDEDLVVIRVLADLVDRALVAAAAAHAHAEDLVARLIERHPQLEEAGTVSPVQVACGYARRALRAGQVELEDVRRRLLAGARS